MHEPLVSIIVPTLNEEKYLPKLLESLSKQTYSRYELIVADAGSEDRTVEIARSFGAKVVEGGTPAVGRNRGYSASNGEYLIFLDADTIVPDDFLERAVEEFDEKYYETATFRFFPLSELNIDKLLFRITNIIVKAGRKLYPFAPGFCIMTTRRMFRRLGGFDESVYLAEDHDFVRRASKLAKFGIVESTFVWVSVRRLDKEGRINLIRKYIKAEAYRLLKGKVDRKIIDYEFAQFERNDLKTAEKLLERLINYLNRFFG